MRSNFASLTKTSVRVAIAVSVGTYFVLQNNADKAAACSVRQYEKLQRRIDKLRIELEKPVVTINSK